MKPFCPHKWRNFAQYHVLLIISKAQPLWSQGEIELSQEPPTQWHPLSSGPFMTLTGVPANMAVCLNVTIKANFPFFSGNIKEVSCILDFMLKDIKIMKKCNRHTQSKEICILYPCISLIKKLLNDWLWFMGIDDREKVLHHQKSPCWLLVNLLLLCSFCVLPVKLLYLCYK